MTDLQINTLVEHYVCRIFQDTAKTLGVPVIAIHDLDAKRLNQAVTELEEMVTHFVEQNAHVAQ